MPGLRTAAKRRPMTEEPEITVVETPRVWCDGAGGIRGGPDYRPAALGHPRVWMQIDEQGFVDCGYCDRRFVLAGGPAKRGMHEISAGDMPEPEAAPGGGVNP